MRIPFFFSAAGVVTGLSHWSVKGMASFSATNALIMVHLAGPVPLMKPERYQLTNIRLLCRAWRSLLDIPSKLWRQFLLLCSIVQYAENKSVKIYLKSWKLEVLPLEVLLSYPPTAHSLIHDLFNKVMAAASGVDNACEKTGNLNLLPGLSTVIIMKEEILRIGGNTWYLL